MINSFWFSKSMYSAERLLIILLVSLVNASFTFSKDIIRGPYLQNQTETSVTIMWVTAGTGSSGKVEVEGVKVFYAVSEDAHESITRHKVIITGLQGNMDYRYRISTDKELQSDWITFHTNKPRGENFRFLIIGDSGDKENQTHQRNVAREMLKADPDFWLHTGDLVLSNYSSIDFDYNTKKHFEVYQQLNQYRPHYPVRGNHEGGYPPSEFRKDFDFPATGTKEQYPEVYDFVYGDIWIASLSTGGPSRRSEYDEICGSIQEGGWQYDWLKKRLNNVAKYYTWKLVMFHRPSYNAAKRYSSFMTDTKPITELCEDYAVDFIAFGHVHSMQRSKPVYRDRVVAENKGIVHMDCSGGGVLNTAGPGQNEYFWTDFVCGDRWGFLQADISFQDQKSTCILTFIDEHGDVINTKSASGVFTKTKDKVEIYPRYKLKVNTRGKGNVALEPRPAFPYGNIYFADTKVTLTAKPDLGWIIDCWGGDLNDSTNPEKIKMDSDKSITVSFMELQKQYEIRLNTEGSGSVILDPPGGIYSPGSIVTVKAVPDSGWWFYQWKDDLINSTNPSTITVNNNISITPVFSLIRHHVLNVNTLGSGKVIPEPADSTYKAGTDVTLTAKPDSGWTFSEWSRDLSGTENKTTVKIYNNIDVTATFLLQKGKLIDLIPTEDSYVRGGIYADDNFNTDDKIIVKTTSYDEYTRYSYLKFDLTKIRDPVVLAILKLTVSNNGLSNGIPAVTSVYSVADDNWNETSITWNNAPSEEMLLDSRKSIDTEKMVYMWDVTSFIADEIDGNKIVSLMLKDDVGVMRVVDFNSRHSSSGPVLTVQISDETFTSGKK